MVQNTDQPEVALQEMRFADRGGVADAACAAPDPFARMEIVFRKAGLASRAGRDEAKDRRVTLSARRDSEGDRARLSETQVVEVRRISTHRQRADSPEIGRIAVFDEIIRRIFGGTNDLIEANRFGKGLQRADLVANVVDGGVTRQEESIADVQAHGVSGVRWAPRSHRVSRWAASISCGPDRSDADQILSGARP